VSNVGLSVSGINMAYNNSGTIGVGDADTMISLKPNHAPTADYVKTMREKLRAVIGGLIFATCATLLLVPTLFSLVHGRKQTRQEVAAADRSIPVHE
jgi:hypothetical protein